MPRKTKYKCPVCDKIYDNKYIQQLCEEQDLKNLVKYGELNPKKHLTLIKSSLK